MRLEEERDELHRLFCSRGPWSRIAGELPPRERARTDDDVRAELQPDGLRPVAWRVQCRVVWRAVGLLMIRALGADSRAPRRAAAVAAGRPWQCGAASAVPATKAKPNAKHLSAGSDPAASSLEAYLRGCGLDNKAAQASPGAIWTESGRLTRMSTDVRAMRPHDLISVVVSESLAASTDGTVKNSRASNASSGISGLIGTLHAGNATAEPGEPELRVGVERAGRERDATPA